MLLVLNQGPATSSGRGRIEHPASSSPALKIDIKARDNIATPQIASKLTLKSWLHDRACLSVWIWQHYWLLLIQILAEIVQQARPVLIVTGRDARRCRSHTMTKS